jgi:hypothetical protein
LFPAFPFVETILFLVKEKNGIDKHHTKTLAGAVAGIALFRWLFCA